MILHDELRAVAEAFGVADTQVRRDHLISHILAAISTDLPERVTFFGGTALARTLLPAGRLSEDIDLIATDPRLEAATLLERSVPRRLARTHGTLTWDPSPTATRGNQAAIVRTDDGLTVRIQLLGAVGYPAWPTQTASIHQRYTDAPPARLRTLTPEAFVTAKTTAWMDRGAARDLYDLYLLARAGYITPAAGALFARIGPIRTTPPGWAFRAAPTLTEWRVQLAEQVRLTVGPEEALTTVREAWRVASADRSVP